MKERKTVMLIDTSRSCVRSDLVRQSADLEEIKAALFEQAYHQCSLVTSWMAQVMAIRKRAGQLQAKTRSTGRGPDVEAVTIQRKRQCPTGGCSIEGQDEEVYEEASSSKTSESWGTQADQFKGQQGFSLQTSCT